MPPPPDLRVVDDPAVPVGELLAAQAHQGGSIVLTGGSAPGAAYERAAALEPDWSKVTLWWGDDRCVPPEHELSNYRLAKETLLDHLAEQPGEVHRIRGELPPAEAANELDGALETAARAGRDLDFLLLGLGPDAHVASLFPGSPQLAVEDRRATSGPAGLEPWVDRVTMTMPEIRSAKRIVFIVTGESKADAVARSFGGEISPEAPASLVLLAPIRVEVFLDRAAASKLDV
jgi:6-phosphogluconolactonase